MMTSTESSISSGIESSGVQKRVDWKTFKPRLSTNKGSIDGLDSARYGLDKPEYNINKPDVLYTIWCNSLHMLQTRGFDILPELKSLLYDDYTLEYPTKFKAWLSKYGSIAQRYSIKLASSLNSSYVRVLSNGMKEVIQMIYVDYSNETTRTMSDKDFNQIIISNDQKYSNMDRVHYSLRLMIISAGDWNTASRKLGANKEYPVELIKWDAFYTNPLENVMSVKFLPLSDEERRKFFLENDRLPSECCMFTLDDPIVFWHGWKPGTLVRILRDDPYLTNICDVRCEYRIVSPNLNPARKS